MSENNQNEGHLNEGRLNEKHVKREDMELWRARAWASMLKEMPHLERISNEGPNDTEHDLQLIMAVCALVAGELIYRFNDQLEGI